MPIVARRFLATSRGSKSGTNVSKTSKSAFADRFGQSDKQLQHAQSSFPAWPSALLSQKGLSQSNANTLRRPPPNLLTLVGKGKEEDDRSKKMSGSHTSSERRRELFSEAIGNISELVRTSSFEAKLAIQPAMEARRQLLLAAKTNMHRFSSLPSPAQYKIDQKEVSESSASAPQNAETPIRALSSSSSSSTDANAPCVVIPAPTTSVELCNAMRHLIQSTTPRPKVARLISTHFQYPTLHTVTSFNIILAHAIRVAPYYSRPIIAQMRASNIVWDATTQKLAVRAHIQVGQWPEAIELAERTWLPEGGSGVSTAPLDVFIELMHFILTPESTQEQVSTMAQRCWRLFPTDANVNASPRLAYNVVRLLVKQGQVDQAVQLTKRLLESLSHVTPGITRYYCAILGLVIRPPKHSPHRPKPRPTPHFRERVELFESLLTHNPSLDLKPDAKLTLCLLENLSRSRNRGSKALHKLGELRAKYGSAVEDSAVRRLIARYAANEGNLRLARAMREREELARDGTVRDLAASPEAGSSSKTAPWVGDNPAPMQSHLEYIRRTGTGNVKWTQLSRSLKRAEEKRRLADPENARVLDEGKRGRAWYTWLQRKRKRILKQIKK
ncbi:hypothetical protein FRC09_001263 [Ceratobasidium sp. 395]|nr:hypothetical protein FRC09_001263 [Ceratobasidium sp. 395]